jgi:hypothetical protein
VSESPEENSSFNDLTESPHFNRVTNNGQRHCFLGTMKNGEKISIPEQVVRILAVNLDVKLEGSLSGISILHPHFDKLMQ